MRKKEQNSKSESSTGSANRFVLRLFITGATPNSTRAVANIKQICENYLKDRYSLEIIDVYQQQGVAEREQLLALPLLIKKSPFPERRLIGDLSDIQKVLKGLGLASNG